MASRYTLEMSNSAWGDQETQYFYALRPEHILNAVEAAGYACTGRCLALNSLENRVFEVEIELDEAPQSASDRFRVVKFYRPGRWTRAQIGDEHDFLLDLTDAGLPVVAPVALSDDGGTVGQAPDSQLFYAIFPKRGGRIPDELTPELAGRLGGLVAQIHNVGAQHHCRERLALDVETYGLANLDFLLERDVIPADIRQRYQQTVEQICKLSAPLFAEARYQRIHGDLHLGNVLLHPDEGLRIVDFDDMLWGPCVQDLWLLAPGRGHERDRLWRAVLENYERFREIDRQSERLIEPLRALRFIHFSAWIAKRWDDPAFPDAFPTFGSERYWQEQLVDLNEQLALIREL